MMKIKCDVCDKEEASMFCCADEAALCDACDQRIHHANKLATKHLRFSLLQPSCKQSLPLCDICQERRAFLFCQEDRAILCIECDVPIHTANEYTQKHNRFLLTGSKLSAAINSDPATSILSETIGSTRHTTLVSDDTMSSTYLSFDQNIFTSSSTYKLDESEINASYPTSSISEYLMETLPGWHIEDFFDPSFPSNAFCKID